MGDNALALRNMLISPFHRFDRCIHCTEQSYFQRSANAALQDKSMKWYTLPVSSEVILRNSETHLHFLFLAFTQQRCLAL